MQRSAISPDSSDSSDSSDPSGRSRRPGRLGLEQKYTHRVRNLPTRVVLIKRSRNQAYAKARSIISLSYHSHLTA
jgi:hypothetical protein